MLKFILLTGLSYSALRSVYLLTYKSSASLAAPTQVSRHQGYRNILFGEYSCPKHKAADAVQVVTVTQILIAL